MNGVADRITIKVHTGIGFEDLLPGSSAENPVEMDVPSDTTLDAIPELAGLQANDRYMTALNGAVVVKSDRSATALAAGDVIEILPPLTGG